MRRSDAPGHRYEIQLVQDVTSRGNLHDLNPVGKQEYSRSRWLYVDTLEGELSSDQVVLASFRHGSPFYRPQTALEGTVRFIPDNKIQIALRVPRYARDSTIERHVDFELNGTYRVVPTAEP